MPDLTVAEYTLRSYSTKYLDEVVERFYNIIKGASLMTDTTYEIQRDLPFKSKVVCHKVNNLLMEKRHMKMHLQLHLRVRKQAQQILEMCCMKCRVHV